MSTSQSARSGEHKNFVDYARITVSSGAGGKGCISFRREKFLPKGGPDGGDGGDGGSVIVQADRSFHTLLDFRYRKHYRAEPGEHGKGKEMTGRSGQNLIIRVPCGTTVRDAEALQVLGDLVRHGDSTVVAQGGEGGRGNVHFATSTRRAPRIAQPGRPGESRTIILELKLLADVGIVGLPNAGKSTFLSSVTSARPKIADYPFTTLVPHLGVVALEGAPAFVLADIPGLIRGAHSGAGLGDLFLRHVERCSLLLHLVDVSPQGPEDPVEAVRIVNEELRRYSPDLSGKTQVIAASKIDAEPAEDRLEKLKTFCTEKRLELFNISSVTGEGVDALCGRLSVLAGALKNE